MRIIAGTARGRRLQAPKGDRVRPTLDRVREALFNILAPRINGARFLDLYAGSGANGIEALSRGAASAFFVDNHAESHAVIQKNLEITGFSSVGSAMRYNSPQDLGRIPGSFDIIFADPPYGYQGHHELLEGLATSGRVEPGGVVIIEHLRKSDLPETAGALNRTQVRPYGATTLSFYA